MEYKNTCAFIFPELAEYPWKYNEKHPVCKKMLEQVCAKVADQVKCGKTEFVTLLSEGMASWGAMLVLALREQMPEVKLTCVLSNETQEEQATLEFRKRYQYILSNADRVACISRQYTSDYLEKSYRYLVDHADYIMAFYCGNPKSPVASAILYAHQKNKWISVLSPDGTSFASLTDCLIAQQPKIQLQSLRQ